VATSFEYQLHQVGPTVTSCIIAHPFDRARDLLRFFREWTVSLPDEQVLFGTLVHAPDEEVRRVHNGLVDKRPALIERRELAYFPPSAMASKRSPLPSPQSSATRTNSLFA
jgi:hypothetical protein